MQKVSRPSLQSSLLSQGIMKAFYASTKRFCTAARTATYVVRIGNKCFGIAICSLQFAGAGFWGPLNKTHLYDVLSRTPGAWLNVGSGPTQAGLLSCREKLVK